MKKENVVVLSRGTKELIKEAIKQTNSSNRYDICEAITKIVVNRYKSGNLEYQLSRMNLSTTKKILAAIDTYFYKYLKLPKAV